jgi:tetratricopeptide (TPR) repeat protein
LVEEVAHEPHGRLTYQCSPHHTESAFHPVIRQLEHAAGIRHEQAPAEKLDRLEVLLRSSSEASEIEVALLASLLSIPVESGPAYGAQELKERTFRALFRQLGDLAAARPVLMVFEDLQWADPSTLELLDRLVERVESLSILILLTARSGFGAAWTDQAHVTALNLNRIGRRDSRVLLEPLAGELPDDLIEAITVRGDGVPLFIEEISRTVLESRREGDGDGTASHAEVPASLQDSLMARLDRLPTAKPVAQTAAALGRDFSRQMLEPICDLPRSGLERALDELVGAGVLNLRGGSLERSYVFKHALVQDTAYSSLLRGSRRQLHRRIAEALGERLADEPGLLAHHWEAAEDLDQALKYRLVAGERAAARSAMSEANAQYWRALELLLQLPESTDTRRHHLATLLGLVRLDGEFWPSDADRGRALQHIDRAIEIATDDSDPAALARLKAYKADRWGQEPLLTEALRHASDAGDQRVKADVHRYFGGYHGMLGRFEESIRHIERAIEMYAGLGADIDQGLLMAGAGRCYSARAGRLERSFHYAGRARAIADATENLALKSWLAMEAEPCLYKGLWQRTIDVVDQELPAAWEIGNWATILWCSGWATIGEVKLGRGQAAHTRIETALKKASQRSQNPFARSYPLIALGHVHLAEGELEAALDATRKASEMADRAEARLERGAAHRLLAQIHEARGDRMAAEAEHRASLEILGTIQSRPELAQSLLAYGRFKRSDDPDQGRRLLEQALALFENMDAAGWIAETRAALEW